MISETISEALKGKGEYKNGNEEIFNPALHIKIKGKNQMEQDMSELRKQVQQSFLILLLSTVFLQL